MTDSNKVQPLTFEQKQDAILLEIYFDAIHSSSVQSLPRKKIIALADKLGISPTFTINALSSFRSSTKLYLNVKTSSYRITDLGIEYIEKQLAIFNSFVFTLAGERSPFFREITAQDSLDVEVEAHGEAIDASIGATDKTKSANTGALLGSEGEQFVLGQSKLGVAPASDRIVTLDHNSPGYETAQRAVDEFYTYVKGINDPDILDNKSREFLIVDLESIKGILKFKNIVLGGIGAFVFSVLYKAQEIIADTAGSMLAQAALDAIKILFGM